MPFIYNVSEDRFGDIDEALRRSRALVWSVMEQNDEVEGHLRRGIGGKPVLERSELVGELLRILRETIDAGLERVSHVYSDHEPAQQ